MENARNHERKLTTELLTPLTERLQVAAMGILYATVEAERVVRDKHPHWFIEYPQGKKIDSSRQQKINSRAKKVRHAIRNEVQEILGNSPEDLIRDGVREYKIVTGSAGPEDEVEYLEDLLVLEPEEQN